jgi:hypothetical protein
MMPWLVAGDEDGEEKRRGEGREEKSRDRNVKNVSQNKVPNFLLFINFALRLGAIACLSGSWQSGRGAISTGSDNLPHQVAAQLVNQTAIGQPQYTRFSTGALLAADWCHCGTGNVKTYFG